MEKRIVVIEDDEIILECLEIVLQGTGFRVVRADNGPDGLALVRQHRPDLVLSDLHMAGFSGLEVLEELREDPETAHIPLVVVTADPSPEVRRRCDAFGVAAFLLKPFDPAELVETIHRLLAGAPPAPRAAPPGPALSGPALSGGSAGAT